MENQVKEWQNECENFSNWFSALGGNIASDEQMTEAFARIEAKNISDSKLYQLLDAEKLTNKN